MITARTAIERMRWHAQSGASAFETMGMRSAYIAARVRLLSILNVLDQFDGCDDPIRTYGSDIESPVGEKLVVGHSDVRQRSDFKFLYLELSEALPLAVNDNV